MKKHAFRIILASLLVVSLALPACTAKDVNEETTATVSAEQTAPTNETEEDTEMPMDTAVVIDPATFGEASIIYRCEDGSVLSTYTGREESDFGGVCAYYRGEGYTLYSSADMGGNMAETYVKGDALAHIYWHPASKELNIVLSDTAGGTLPPATPEVTDGEYACTVVQLMQADKVNGMGYIIQLKDGSYIVYDGGWDNLTTAFENYLTKNYHGEGKPIIRAWVMTHSHGDHYPVFQKCALRAKRSEKYVVENFIFSPLNDESYSLNAEEIYLSDESFAKDISNFTGTNVIFAHTGMKFTFCNLDMEILYAPESYYKTTSEIGNFNNTSIVSRLYGEGYSALFTGDVGIKGTDIMEELYGDYLQSDMCQISHHGVEDVPLSFYEYVKAPILFYPCNQSLYDQTGRHWEERKAMEQWDCTKEILIAGLGQYVRAWGTSFDADAPLSMPDYEMPELPIGTGASVQNGTGTRDALRVEYWIAYRTRVNGEITGFSFDIPTWATTGSACTLAVYAWNTDVATTLSAEPIASKRFEKLTDNASHLMNFPAPLAAGEYLFVLRDVTGTAGVYYNQGCTDSLGTLYTPNGESADQPSLNIYFTELPSEPFSAAD